MYNNEVIDICFKKEVALLVFDLMVFLLIVFAIAEGVCLILLYHRIFYQKKQSIDVFFYLCILYWVCMRLAVSFSLVHL